MVRLTNNYFVRYILPIISILLVIGVIAYYEVVTSKDESYRRLILEYATIQEEGVSRAIQSMMMFTPHTIIFVVLTNKFVDSLAKKLQDKKRDE